MHETGREAIAKQFKNGDPTANGRMVTADCWLFFWLHFCFFLPCGLVSHTTEYLFVSYSFAYSNILSNHSPLNLMLTNSSIISIEIYMFQILFETELMNRL
jgi:hypothetical protein